MLRMLHMDVKKMKKKNAGKNTDRYNNEIEEFLQGKKVMPFVESQRIR